MWLPLWLLSVFLRPSFAQTFPNVVPAVHSITLSSGSPFSLSSHLQIVVDNASASVRDTDGLTLVPPTVLEFAKTFAQDLYALFPQTAVNVTTNSASSSEANPSSTVFLTVLSETEAANFTFANGVHTSEGYRLQVDGDMIRISGAGARGVFWATRTLLQGLVLNGGELPSGVVDDQPDWETRGFMLDVGRQWYPISFLEELCTYASWFKTSEFHVHLSDNVAIQNDDAAATYARFRLRPEDPSLAGLTPHLNETYSRDEFEHFQTHCAARGVTVIPEIEAPGHALVITQWKPELGLTEDPTLLNLTFPDTIPTVQSIWQEFLPWLHTRQVSIGADEYNADLADDYINFVNAMSDFIGESNKSIRIWGTKEPSNTTAVSKNITIQHWEFSDDDPFELINTGYNVINSDDAFLYIVIKFSGSFPQQLNQTRLWQGANVDLGGIWDPHVFDRGNASNNPGVNNPLLQGAITPSWNDHGPTASTYLEAFYAVKMGLPVVMSAAWQSSTRPNHLTEAQFLSSFATLAAAAPGQNLARQVPHSGKIIVEYDLTNTSSTSGESVPDRSGNGYNATLVNDQLFTPLGSKGLNYTFLVNVSSSLTSGVLLFGPDNTFGFAPVQGGTTLAFVSSNITYPLFDYTLPLQATSPWRQIIVTGTEEGTSVFVDGQHAGDFQVQIDDTATVAPMSFVVPAKVIGQMGATVSRFILWDQVQDVGDLAR
ncbi:glycoside hydrolase [Amylostereum chailletii]|nr:glycoside hydrolase [Amylostereum chailletii]